MSKLSTLLSASLMVGALAVANIPTAEAADACVTRDFRTELVKQACAKGGQKEAKDAMKAWMKGAKVKSCNQCHAKLTPNYELKRDGVEQFRKLGGR